MLERLSNISVGQKADLQSLTRAERRRISLNHGCLVSSCTSQTLGFENGNPSTASLQGVEKQPLGNGLTDVNEGQGAESLKVHFITPQVTPDVTTGKRRWTPHQLTQFISIPLEKNKTDKGGPWQ